MGCRFRWPRRVLYQLFLSKNKEGRAAIGIKFAKEINNALIPDFIEPDNYALLDINGQRFEFNFDTKKALFDFVQGKSLGTIRALNDKEIDDIVQKASLTLAALEFSESAEHIQEYATSSDFSGFDSPTEGVAGSVKDANFAQSKVRSDENFSDEGKTKYSELAKSKITTINDLADALKTGKISSKEVPVDYVVIDNKKVILNTRTSAALNRAGIPQSQWSGINKTGVKVPNMPNGETFDDLAKQQMKSNKVSPVGTSKKPE